MMIGTVVTVGLVAVLFGTALPVADVNLLRSNTEFLKALSLRDIDQCILDAVRESLIIGMAEWGVTPSYQCREFVKLDVIFSDMHFIAHAEGIESLLRVCGRIRRTEIDAEFLYERIPVIHPWLVVSVSNGRFEPLESSSLQIR
jgi:hypothetical protein